MTRTRMLLVTLGVAGAVTLGACAGPATSPAPAPAVPVDLVAETEALDALGAAAEPSARADRKDKAGPARRLLRKNTLHGELTVQTEQGVRTVAVQRGEVTAATAAGVTVRSADGFTQAWAFGDKLRVRQDRKDADRAAVKVGAQVAVAGARDGDTATARLIKIV